MGVTRKILFFSWSYFPIVISHMLCEIIENTSEAKVILVLKDYFRIMYIKHFSILNFREKTYFFIPEGIIFFLFQNTKPPFCASLSFLHSYFSYWHCVLVKRCFFAMYFGFKSRLQNVLSLCAWRSCFISLCFSFLICTAGLPEYISGKTEIENEEFMCINHSYYFIGKIWKAKGLSSLMKISWNLCIDHSQNQFLKICLRFKSTYTFCFLIIFKTYIFIFLAY